MKLYKFIVLIVTLLAIAGVAVYTVFTNDMLMGRETESNLTTTNSISEKSK